MERVIFSREEPGGIFKSFESKGSDGEDIEEATGLYSDFSYREKRCYKGILTI